MFFKEIGKWNIIVIGNIYEKDYEDKKNLRNDDLIDIFQSEGTLTRVIDKHYVMIH